MSATKLDYLSNSYHFHWIWKFLQPYKTFVVMWPRPSLNLTITTGRRVKRTPANPLWLP